MSADAAAFLRAIADDFEDDTPRLVYADWLDDHGNAARAEFIRVQCELARLPPPRFEASMTDAEVVDHRATEKRRQELQQRESALLRKNLRHWKHEGPPDSTTSQSDFHRGFVARDFHAGHFYNAPPALWPNAGLQIFTFCDAVEKHGPLLADPRFLHVMRLDLSRVERKPPSAMSKIACMVATAPNVVNLRYLNISGNGKRGVDDASVARLASSRHLSGLRHLCLGGANIGPAGVAALAQSKSLRNLLYLDLTWNRITTEGALVLAESKTLAKLVSLNVSSSRIRARGARALAERFGDRVRL